MNSNNVSDMYKNCTHPSCAIEFSMLYNLRGETVWDS